MREERSLVDQLLDAEHATRPHDRRATGLRVRALGPGRHGRGHASSPWSSTACWRPWAPRASRRWVPRASEPSSSRWSSRTRCWSAPSGSSACGGTTRTWERTGLPPSRPAKPGRTARSARAAIIIAADLVVGFFTHLPRPQDIFAFGRGPREVIVMGTPGARRRPLRRGGLLPRVPAAGPGPAMAVLAGGRRDLGPVRRSRTSGGSSTCRCSYWAWPSRGSSGARARSGRRSRPTAPSTPPRSWSRCC